MKAPAADHVIPGLRDQIVFQEAATPLTHTRYTGSTAGTSYGIAAAPSNPSSPAGRRRRSPGSSSRAPRAGASMGAGHGIVGAMTSGVQAAERILGDGCTARVLGAS